MTGGFGSFCVPPLVSVRPNGLAKQDQSHLGAFTIQRLLPKTALLSVQTGMSVLSNKQQPAPGARTRVSMHSTVLVPSHCPTSHPHLGGCHRILQVP